MSLEIISANNIYSAFFFRSKCEYLRGKKSENRITKLHWEKLHVFVCFQKKKKNVYWSS